MPLFYVVFSAVVVDQPDHPLVRRQVEGLHVHAPSAFSACIHAARVTRGAGEPVAIYEETGRLVWGEGPALLDVTPDSPAAVQEDDSTTPAVTQFYKQPGL